MGASLFDEERVMMKSLHGVVHGQTIELSEPISVADGQEVEVTIKVVSTKHPWGEGLRRCAGALSKNWTKDDDRILADIQRDRSDDQRRDVVERAACSTRISVRLISSVPPD